ncbi:integrin beta 8/collagen, type V/XI/XXIV/XXVII, alpha [Streptomyces sp. DvalAA-19]|nr:integrin beta 8/collagen, type V/XI/XXIV/XXVII, alpha [Streptomyces sp. DvalAA-19]
MRSPYDGQRRGRAVPQPGRPGEAHGPLGATPGRFGEGPGSLGVPGRSGTPGRSVVPGRAVSDPGTDMSYPGTGTGMAPDPDPGSDLGRSAPPPAGSVRGPGRQGVPGRSGKVPDRFVTGAGSGVRGRA